MQELLVEVDGRAVKIDTEHVVSIGRAVDAGIHTAGETVSRAHAELRPSHGGWTLVDLNSKHGTYVDGRQVSELRVVTPLTVHLGLAETGVTMEIRDAEEASLDPADGSSAIDADKTAAYAQTLHVTARTGQGADKASERSGPDLVVRVAGTDHRFTHPARISIGRVPECDVVVTDPSCSRVHGHIESTDGGWTYVNASEQGTFARGRRVQTIKLREPTAFRLGHPDAGAEIEVTPVLSSVEAVKRTARGVRRRRLQVAALVGVAVAALVVGALVFLPGDDDLDRLTALELDSAKVATVLITAEAETTDGELEDYGGSGSIISSDGMILTNAHVAAPATPELVDRYGPDELGNPEYLEISLIKDANDSPAAPAYRARVVRTLGNFDASLIKIYSTIDGEELPGKLNLPTLPLGDSDKLRGGDEVTLLGFPAIAQSDRVTITRGVISTFIDYEELGERAEIDTDARIAAGNSGGAAINNAAELIGIPSATFGVEGDAVESGRIIPINKVLPLIKGS